jgi:hypothetical protein
VSARVGPLPSSVRVFLFGADSVGALVDSFCEVSALDAVSARLAEQLGDDAPDKFRHQLARATAISSRPWTSRSTATRSRPSSSS